MGNGPGEADDPYAGDFFLPCTISCPGANANDYFGEYLSGAFISSDPNIFMVAGAWGDSREGCDDQSIPFVHHQHVWSGNVSPQ